MHSFHGNIHLVGGSHPISHQPRMGSNLIHPKCETCFNISELFIVHIFFNTFLKSEVLLLLQLLFFYTLVGNQSHTG